MFLSRKQLFLAIIGLHYIIPIGLLLSTLYLIGKPIVIVIPSLIILNGVFLLIFKGGSWEFVNYYLRYLFIAAFSIITLVGLLYMEVVEVPSIIQLLIGIILSLVALGIVAYNIIAISATQKPEGCMKLTFPFKKGKYLITDGGDGKKCAIINYHYKATVHNSHRSNTSMRFATDIAMLDKMGRTVKTILTDDNREYKIFRERVFSPCGGKVIQVVNGIDNNEPFSKEFPYNVGNCIVIRKKDHYILLGHLEKNSIRVKVGERVHTGQLLGSIGNSGLTPRPHLHLQVSNSLDGNFWEGEGVPIIFNKYFYPVKNRIIHVG